MVRITVYFCISHKYTLVIPIQTDRKSYSQADCWLQDDEGSYCIVDPTAIG